jgi:ribonucleoside-triphosphate reductase
MVEKVIKRDGRIVDFDRSKIYNAVVKAMIEVDGELTSNAENLAEYITSDINQLDKEELSVEEIQDLVEDMLMESNRKDVAKCYIRYRYKHEIDRNSNTTDKTIFELLNGSNEYWNSENSNKNNKVVTVQRDYIAGITNTDITRRFLLTPEIVKAHDEGIIHFHDADYFAQNALTNCELVNLDDMLQNGTVINNVLIEKPHKFSTACTIATQIILAVTSSTYGGCTVTLTHLAPFVRLSYNRYLEKYLSKGISKEDSEIYAKEDLKKEINDGCQTFIYQVNSMTNTNGQSPFLSVCMYLGETEEYKEELAMIIEEFLNQRILGFKNEQGVYITPAFPKLLYVLEEDNIHEDSKYYYLTKLAAKCTAKRLVPDYISEKVMMEHKIDKNGNGNCYPCMGCRSFLTPDRIKGNIANAKNYDENKSKYYGRFNQGVVTINLADIAFSARKIYNEEDNEKDLFDIFWDLFDERTELCHKALQIRHERLSMVSSDVAPILWQYGALARLGKNEPIHSLLHGGYSTLSLGYAALYECAKVMTGYSHTEPKVGKPFALKVMQELNNKCAKWKSEEDIDYSLYGSPIETTTYKFATNLKRRFGDDIFIKLDGKDRNFVTNSYHVAVFEKINPFEKLKLESEFQKLSPGGAISYVETANLTDNIDIVLEVIKFIYDNIMYAELNTKSDYCQACGYDGELKIIDEDGYLDWQCPACGNRDHRKLHVARRTCGYIGTNFFNQGRTDEIRNRYVHIDNHNLIEE